MKRYDIRIDYPSKGTRFGRVEEATVIAVNIGGAINKAFRVAKATGGLRDYREVAGANIVIRVLVGGPIKSTF